MSDDQRNRPVVTARDTSQIGPNLPDNLSTCPGFILTRWLIGFAAQLVTLIIANE
jgi:hypothetical protein